MLIQNIGMEIFMKYHLPLVVGRVALFTITITSTKVYTKNITTITYKSYTNKNIYACMQYAK